jgi:hypothetical protein
VSRRRNGDDGDASQHWVDLPGSQERPAVLYGQHEIEQDQVGSLAFDLIPRLNRSSDRLSHETFGIELLPQHKADRGFVFHDEYARGP